MSDRRDWYSDFVIAVDLGVEEGHSVEKIWTSVRELLPTTDDGWQTPDANAAIRSASEVVNAVETPAEKPLDLFRQYVELLVEAYTATDR